MDDVIELGANAFRFAVAIGDLATLEALGAAFLELIAPLRLSAAACGLVSGPRAAAKPLYFAAWPADWIAYYQANDLLLSDPVVRWARNSGRALTFGELPDLLPPRDPGRRVIAAAARFGFLEGLATPTRSVDNSLGLVTVAGARGPFNPYERAFLVIVSHAVFTAAERIDRNGAGGKPAPIVSRREIDCVNLLAHGHSDRQIGKLLGLTVRTVRYHLANAREKCQAGSRTHLAAIAISQGWVNL
jgi:LuxR family quorum-sensing system transcriptional regulator CciR